MGLDQVQKKALKRLYKKCQNECAMESIPEPQGKNNYRQVDMPLKSINMTFDQSVHLSSFCSTPFLSKTVRTPLIVCWVASRPHNQFLRYWKIAGFFPDKPSLYIYLRTLKFILENNNLEAFVGATVYECVLQRKYLHKLYFGTFF